MFGRKQSSLFGHARYCIVQYTLRMPQEALNTVGHLREVKSKTDEIRVTQTPTLAIDRHVKQQRQDLRRRRDEDPRYLIVYPRQHMKPQQQFRRESTMCSLGAKHCDRVQIPVGDAKVGTFILPAR